MKQATLNLDLSAKKTRQQVFLDQSLCAPANAEHREH